MNPVFTIGHSTRSVEELAGMLRESRVQLLVDVRSIPRSRTNPQFNRDALPEALEAWQIGYLYLAALGGRRGRVRAAGPSPNGWWQLASFRNYADYALTPPFAEGLALLLDEVRQRRCAVMCAEAVWWRCHRRIIADWLLAAGCEVFHILGPGHVDPASLTPAAVVSAGGIVTYPPEE